MILPRSEDRGRIVRVLTHGKAAEAVDLAIVGAIEDGHRVLVKVASAADTPAAQSAGADAAADWAAALSKVHGLAWARVGADILFHRSAPPAAPGAL